MVRANVKVNLGFIFNEELVKLRQIDSIDENTTQKVKQKVLIFWNFTFTFCRFSFAIIVL